MHFMIARHKEHFLLCGIMAMVAVFFHQESHAMAPSQQQHSALHVIKHAASIPFYGGIAYCLFQHPTLFLCFASCFNKDIFCDSWEVFASGIMSGGISCLAGMLCLKNMQKMLCIMTQKSIKGREYE